MQLRHPPPHSCSSCSNSACDSIQWSRKRYLIILSYLILNSAIDRQDETRILMIILSFMSINTSFVIFTSCASFIYKISRSLLCLSLSLYHLLSSLTQNSLSLSHHTISHHINSYHSTFQPLISVTYSKPLMSLPH